MAKEEKGKRKSNQVLTPEFRVSYPAVFEPRSAIEGQEKKFSLVMLFDKKTNIDALKNAAVMAIQDKWGPDKAKWPKNLRLPFRDGSEKDTAGYEDTTFISASSKTKPGVVDADVVKIIDPGEFYGGCYARATVRAFAYDVSGNRGVAFWLQNVQKTRDGEPLGGKNKPESDFDAIAVPEGSAKEQTEDPLAGIGV